MSEGVKYKNLQVQLNPKHPFNREHRMIYCKQTFPSAFLVLSLSVSGIWYHAISNYNTSSTTTKYCPIVGDKIIIDESVLLNLNEMSKQIKVYLSQIYPRTLLWELKM